MEKKKIGISLLIGTLIVYLMYWKVVHYNYIWDDLILFIENSSLRNPTLSWEIISRPVIEGSAYFRPLVFLTWFYEFKIFGQNPSISHFINLNIFLLNSWLTYILALQVFNDKKNKFVLAALVLFIYIINPVLIESTTWISGRFDLLSTFFILLAINIFIKNYNRMHMIKSASVAFFIFLALISKEVAIITPILIFFLTLYKEKIGLFEIKKIFKSILKFKKMYFFIMVIYFLYFYLRYISIGTVASVTYNATNLREIFYHYIPFQAFYFYNLNFNFPWFFVKPIIPMQFDISLQEKIKLISVFLLVTCVVVLSGFRKYRNIWLYLCSLVTILLVLYIVPFNNGNNIANFRFMTLGVSFSSIFIVSTFYDILNFIKEKKMNILMYVFFIFSFFWCFISIVNFNQSIRIWANEYSLWKASYYLDKTDNQTKFNYGIHLIRTGQYEELKKIMNNGNDSFNTAEQALYAEALLNMGDKESLLYYRGLLESLPKFHMKYKSIDSLNTLYVLRTYGMEFRNIGAAYSNYGIGLVLFDNDLVEAQKQIDIAKWYVKKNDRINILSNQYIIYYLSGKKHESEAVLNEIKKINSIKINNLENSMKNFIMKYCKIYPESKEC